MLNSEQEAVFKAVVEGHNVFLTGGGGVGKSYTIETIVEWAHAADKLVGLCAMTGSAASLIGGTTLHSFMGIGLARDSAETLARRISRGDILVAKLQAMNILIIDESSMLNDELFTKVSTILKIIRKNMAEPFGGLQIILVGDPFQLAPIEGSYCFLSDEWDQVNFKAFLLKINMRQKDDVPFQELLERLRWGNCSADDYATLLTLRKTSFPDGIIPTRLFSKNVDVDRINADELQKLLTTQSEEIGETVLPTSYPTKYSSNAQKKRVSKKWAESIKIPDSIGVCIGAQVMLIYNINIEAGLVNGSRGVVTGMRKTGVLVKFVSGLETLVEYHHIKIPENRDIDFSYIPLKLAWCVTIHKSQGMTLDAVEIDLGNSIFANGQAYTAISRARNMRSVKLVDVKKTSFKAHPAVIDFYRNLD